jgi:hypothetical protein
MATYFIAYDLYVQYTTTHALGILAFAQAHLMRALAVQHEQSSQLEAVMVGAVVHVASRV